MIDHAAMADQEMMGITLIETLQPVAMLLGGVPILTVLAMTAAHYVISGSL